MPKFMAAADVLVTKAGPATISEACLAGLPMILYDAIPGQETGNVNYVVDNDAGVFTPSPRGVADALAQWIAGGPSELERLSANAAGLARANAVWDIAEAVWNVAQQGPIPTGRRSPWLELKDHRLAIKNLRELAR
jgi:1,2-diacylglycerol 3-beta-galactosyltransferase